MINNIINNKILIKEHEKLICQLDAACFDKGHTNDPKLKNKYQRKIYKINRKLNKLAEKAKELGIKNIL